MGLKVKISSGFTFCSFMFQAGHSNIETIFSLNGPTSLQIINE